LVQTPMAGMYPLSVLPWHLTQMPVSSCLKTPAKADLQRLSRLLRWLEADRAAGRNHWEFSVT